MSQSGNYKGITLLEVAYKIFVKIIDSCLQPIAEKVDAESQFGFCPGRGCRDAVFTTKLVMKKSREHCKKNLIVFLDLVKVFNRVPYDLL